MASKIEKIDLWTEHKDLFSPKAGIPELVRVPPFTYLMVDGTGDPNTSPAFRAAIGALYSLAYTLKFGLKKKKGVDFRVLPSSGRYHAEDPAVFLERAGRTEWKWTLMIPLPSIVTTSDLNAARQGGAGEEERLPRPAAGPARGAAGRSVRPGAAHRPVRRGALHHRSAPRLHRRKGPHLRRQPPRDLHLGPQPHGTGEAEDHRPTAGQEGLRHSQARVGLRPPAALSTQFMLTVVSTRRARCGPWAPASGPRGASPRCGG